MRSRDLNAKNFGIKDGSGHICQTADEAAKMFFAEKYADSALSKNSVKTDNRKLVSLNNYVRWAKEENINRGACDKLPVKNLAAMNDNHLKAYADHLLKACTDGVEGKDGKIKTIEPKTARNLLSNVKTLLQEMSRGRANVSLTPKVAGLPTVSGVATKDHSATKEAHQTIKAAVSPMTALMMNVQRDLGMRLSESIKTNFSALEKAIASGESKVRVDDGTKGGRPRDIDLGFVPDRPAAVLAIRQAAAFQRQHGAESMLGVARIEAEKAAGSPVKGVHDALVQKVYSEINAVKQTHKDNPAVTAYTPHKERHSFANRMYEKLTGSKSPVQFDGTRKQQIAAMAAKLGITYREALRVDAWARKEVAEALGHGRMDVTSAYIGGGRV